MKDVRLNAGDEGIVVGDFGIYPIFYFGSDGEKVNLGLINDFNTKDVKKSIPEKGWGRDLLSLLRYHCLNLRAEEEIARLD